MTPDIPLEEAPDHKHLKFTAVYSTGPSDVASFNFLASKDLLNAKPGETVEGQTFPDEAPVNITNGIGGPKVGTGIVSAVDGTIMGTITDPELTAKLQADVIKGISIASPTKEFSTSVAPFGEMKLTEAASNPTMPDVLFEILRQAMLKGTLIPALDKLATDSGSPFAWPVTKVVTPNGETHTDNTLFVVHESLHRAGLNPGQINDAINEMQNHGILFRELDR